jgi:hypothetical protein
MSTIRRLVLIAPVMVLAAGMPIASARVAPAPDKSIFVAVLDDAGKPVKDLDAGDFRLREDGVDREIVSVKAATDPLQVVLLADTTAEAESLIRDVRTAAAGFIKQLHTSSPDAPVSLVEFGQAAMTVVPFVTDEASLQNGINKLVGRPGAASVLLEAIIDASNNLAKRPSPRRAIVSVNIEPSNEQSREEPGKINDTMRKSVAQLWSVSLQKGALKNPKRDVVLNAVTRNTVGLASSLSALLPSSRC